MLKPFLKWAGNKYQIINRIKATLPEGKRLIEPFLGSGAVFLNTDFPEYYLSDINKDIINLYNTLKYEGKNLVSYCETLFIEGNNNPTKYYQIREEFNKTEDIVRKSALLIYLNKHGYNGLCRYNSNGGYNVPFGRYKKPYFPEKEMIYFWQKAQDAIFVCEDFVEVMGKAQLGDVLYCDPPYIPISDTSNFTNYSSNGFGLPEQLKLAEEAKKLAAKGVTVLISNHENEFIIKAYETAKIDTFSVQRYISCNGAKRNKVGEVLALFSGGGLA